MSCVMGRRCKGLQVEQLLMKFLVWCCGIFYIWCKEPALVCNKASYFLGVAKETNLLASYCHESWGQEGKNVFEYV